MVPVSSGRLTAGEETSRLVRVQREQCIIQGDIYIGAASGAVAGNQRRQDRVGCEHPGGYVSNRHSDLGGGTVRHPGDTHQPRGALRDLVIAGQRRLVLAVTADRRVDELGLARSELLWPQAEARGSPRLETLHHHVRCHRQGARGRPPSPGLQVEHHAPLVAVDRQEVAGLAFDEWGPPLTRMVASPGRLQLDHVGAQVAEQHRAVGTRQRVGEIQDADALERH